MIKNSKTYIAFDEGCGALLTAKGFTRHEAGDYSRVGEDGLDRLLVDERAGKGRFVVFMSYYPKDLEFVYKLSDAKEPRGFPVGPYLGFNGVFNREYVWAGKSLELVKNAPPQIVLAIETYGLPWLDSLRDPVYFSQQVDKSAVLYAAVAFERAGFIEEAKQYYAVMYARLRAGLAGGVSEQQFIKIAGKRFAFVARKLGRDQELVGRTERILNWSCPALPIDTRKQR